MKTRQVNLRLEAGLVAALEEVAREESLERGTVVRRILLEGLTRHRVERAFQRYQRGEISLGRLTEDAGLSHWDAMEEVKRRGIAYPLTPEEARAQLDALALKTSRVAEPTMRQGEWDERASRGPAESRTLPDRAPKPGGVLLVGVNPAPISCQAGHYYQGRLGRRLWKRLTRLNLLDRVVPGKEDNAFVAGGNGLTDVVKRCAASADEIGAAEFREGAKILREKIRAWSPGLILFTFKRAATAATGEPDVPVGIGPPLEGVPTFLLSSPYSPGEDTRRVDDQLRRLLSKRTGKPGNH